MTARTSSSVSVVAPDSTGSTPTYSANARCMIERTSSASASEATRTSGAEAVGLVGKHLPQEAVGDGEGAPARFDSLARAPGSKGDHGPGRTRGQPQQRLDRSRAAATRCSCGRQWMGSHWSDWLLGAGPLYGPF